MAKGPVIVISSHVARGSVGNRAMVFALERLGFPVWAVPTLVLPHHPGHGPVQRIVPDDNAFATLLQALLENSASSVRGIVSGYLASPGQARAVAALVRSARAASPDLIYLCDPVIGDGASLYVAEAVATAIGEELLPLADVATPNAFECAWLADCHAAGDRDLAALAAALPPPTMLVTSAPALMRGHMGNLLVQADETHLLEHPALPTRAKGTGDLLAAILLGRRLEGHGWPKAAGMACASIFEMVAGTARAGADELLLAELQHAIVQPRAPVSSRRIAGRTASSPRLS